MPKKMKTVSPFRFLDKTKQEMVDIVNKNMRITLKYNKDLVNRVHKRYPLLNEEQIGVIIRNIFTAMRDLLILGKILNFMSFMFDVKLLFFTHKRDGDIFPGCKVSIKTPPPMRKKDNI